MKKCFGLLLCLLMIVSLLGTAVAAEMVSSVEQKQKDVADSATAVTEDGEKIDVIMGTGTTTEDREIIITPVSALSGGEIGGNLNQLSKDKIVEILTAALSNIKTRDLVALTADSRFSLEERKLSVCNLFEITYAETRNVETEYAKKTYLDSPITVTFKGITDTIVAVLHGTDDGTYWEPMEFEQNGTTVTVFRFEDFSPVALITSTDGKSADIQPADNGGGGNQSGGSGTTIPTSPQTGEVAAAWLVCAVGMLFLGGSAWLRRKERCA